MKYCTIAILTLLTVSAKAQETPVKRNEYKVISVTYSSYSKPQSSDLYRSNLLLGPNTYDDLSRNIGVTLKYSQMNFLKNCGLEYGIGMELMLISNRFNFTLPSASGQSSVSLSPNRSNVGYVTVPLYYVHRIELGNRFTLFPKIGVDAKVLITNPDVRRGIYTDSLNSFNYSVGHETTQRYENGPFQNVFLNGTIGTTLTWSTKKGAAFGLQLAFSVQLLRNTLLTRITDIRNKEDGYVSFDSNYFQTNDFLAENKMTNFSVGISYVFGK